MKIISYSDLHLEFGTDFRPPAKSDADLMILAGDIITFRDFAPLGRFLDGWTKPVLYVAGNLNTIRDARWMLVTGRFATGCAIII